MPTQAVLEITLPQTQKHCYSRTQKHCYKLEKLEMRVSLKSKILPKLQHLFNVIGPSAGILTEEGSPELPAAVVTKYHRQGLQQQKCIPSQVPRLAPESPVWAEPQPSKFLEKDSFISSSS